MSAPIYLVTGLMASGKSTVAQALAERFPMSVHLRGDLFRRMIVHGQAHMSFDLSPEAEAQLKLRYDLAIEAAKRYADAEFTVVYQDIILGKSLEKVVAEFAGRDLKVAVLSPDAESVWYREQNRGKSGYGSRGEVDAFDRVLREETPKIGTWIDSSKLTVRETVDAILAG
ncbi:MAG: AAA family ATPase [Dehalococcoidia bacterium]